jgi:hypothetical protein
MDVKTGRKEFSTAASFLDIAVAKPFQIHVWYDTKAKKYKREAGDKFDPETDRVAMAWAKLDVKKLQKAGNSRVNQAENKEREWVQEIARKYLGDTVADKAIEDEKIQAGHVIAGNFGGSGKLADGNLVPLWQSANVGIGTGEKNVTFFLNNQEEHAPETVTVGEVLQYDDTKEGKALQWPTKVTFYWGYDMSISGITYFNLEKQPKK